jgi:hypothetical protein
MVEDRKIMTTPLPAILDELEDYQRALKDAVDQANQAAEDAREAASKAVKEVEDKLTKIMNRMTADLCSTKDELHKLANDVSLEASAVDKAMTEAKNIHAANSPFLSPE